jgi:hypothetical protein
MGEEGHRRGGPAFRADDTAFHASPFVGVFRLALFAMAGLMGKTLIPEEELFPGAEDKFLAAIDALENTVGEFHRSTSPELHDLQLLDLNLGY